MEPVSLGERCPAPGGNERGSVKERPGGVGPRTRAYVERRTAEGRTLREIRRCLKRYLAREIRRCLKRYLAREIYRRLNTTTRLHQTAA